MIPLDENITCSSGNKAKNLSTLLRAGFSVPKGFVIPSETYRTHVCNLKEEINALIGCEPPQQAANKIRQLLQKNTPEFSFPNNFSGVYAVRSSGSYVKDGKKVLEDSTNESMAGQFDSFLYVPSKNVPQAIVDCWSSLFNERRLSSIIDDTYVESEMSVVIQEMVPAQYSAVMMTKDPVDDRNVCGVESTIGDCEAIVSGSVTGDLHLIDRLSGRIIERELGLKEEKYLHKKILETSNEEKQTFCLSDEKVLELYNLGRKIESFFGSPQDIEAVFNKQWYVVQTRPITGGIK